MRKNNFATRRKVGICGGGGVAVQRVVAHAVPVAQRKIGFGKLARVVKSDEPPQNWVRKFEKIFESDEPPEFWVRKIGEKF